MEIIKLEEIMQLNITMMKIIAFDAERLQF